MSAQAGRAIQNARGRWAAEWTPVPTRPRTLTLEFRLTSRLRSAALHFRQEPPSNLRATHFRALTGRGTPTGNGRPLKRRGGGETGKSGRPARRSAPYSPRPEGRILASPEGTWDRVPPPKRQRPGERAQGEATPLRQVAGAESSGPMKGPNYRLSSTSGGGQVSG